MRTPLALSALALLFCPVAWGQFDPTPQTRLVPMVARTGFAPGVGVNTWRESPAADYHNAVVIIQCPGGAAGSGCIVELENQNNGIIAITNHHVVATQWLGNGFSRETFRQVSIRGRAATVPANVIYSDPSLDLAVLHSPNATSRTSIPISGTMPAVGTELEMGGFGGPDQTLRHFFGKRVNTRYKCSIDAGTVSGDSGGPMIWPGETPAIVGVNFGAPGRPGSRGRVAGWSVSGPASSEVDGPTLAKVLTQVCTPLGCQPRIIYRTTPQPIAPPSTSVGAQGPAGRDGVNGAPGEMGLVGPRGEQGPAGGDGRGVEKMYADNKGNIYVVYTDQSEHRIGNLYDMRSDDVIAPTDGSVPEVKYFGITKREN